MWCVFAQHLFCARYSPNTGVATRQEPPGSSPSFTVQVGEELTSIRFSLLPDRLNAVYRQWLLSTSMPDVRDGPRARWRKEGWINRWNFEKEKQIQMLWFPSFSQEQIRSLAFFEPVVPESFALWPGSNPSATQHLERHWPQADRKGWAHALAAGSLRNLFQGWEEPAGASTHHLETHGLYTLSQGSFWPHVLPLQSPFAIRPLPSTLPSKLRFILQDPTSVKDLLYYVGI